jgi:hypothetical protein
MVYMWTPKAGVGRSNRLGRANKFSLIVYFSVTGWSGFLITHGLIDAHRVRELQG